MDLGFSEALKCSACDKLGAIGVCVCVPFCVRGCVFRVHHLNPRVLCVPLGCAVEDEDLEGECRSCCTDAVGEATVKAYRARLDVCQ